MSSRKALTAKRRKKATTVIPRTVARKVHTLKYFDVHFGNFSPTATPSYGVLSNMPQGFAQSERVADTVRLVRIQIRYNITAANSDVFNLVRITFFIWKQNSASTTPGSTSIYEDPTTFGVLTPLNYEGRMYYRILSDVTHNMTGVAAAPTTTSQIYVERTIELGESLQIANTPGVSTGTGQIYFVHMSDSAIPPNPVMYITTRVWYYDD